MYGIDAPEKAQDYGMDAKANLARLILHKTVKVRKVDNDNYGRSIVKVSYDGTDVNASMVESGLAWHYYKYSNSNEKIIEQAGNNQKKTATKIVNPPGGRSTFTFG
jgi:endonuclease YncB( thermonuclease family)